MTPKAGDIVTIDFGGSGALYYGVLHDRYTPRENSFTAYSLAAEIEGHGHDGDNPTRRGRPGHWYTRYDNGKLNSGIDLVPIPPRKIASPVRSGSTPRVTLSRAGRLGLNVAPVHGGPYGEGTVASWSAADICTVRWDNGFHTSYSTAMLDIVLPTLMQKSLWEKPQRDLKA